MDIDTHLRLRSFVKPTLSPIFKTVFFALFIHFLFLVNIPSLETHAVAEIPQWVNIKLVAGFESIDKETEENEIKELKPAPIVKKIIVPLKQKERKQNKTTNKTRATTYIAADSKPYFLENPKPVYPAAARRRGMQGVVLLGVAVSKEGDVENINIIKTSGFRILDKSAMTSVKLWRFIPAKRDGENISSQMEIPIRFTLRV